MDWCVHGEVVQLEVPQLQTQEFGHEKGLQGLWKELQLDAKGERAQNPFG